MPNNFRIAGDYYVSKEGSDSNDGLTPETPKLTIQAGLNLATVTGKRIVIGSGVYTEDISKSVSSAFVLTMVGDGLVVIQSRTFNDSFAMIQAAGNLGFTCYIKNIRFLNYYRITSNSGNGQFSSMLVQYESCSFINCTFLNTNTAIYNTNIAQTNFNYCTLIQCNNLISVISTAIPGQNILTFFNSIVLNSSLIYKTVNQFLNSYLGDQSTIDMVSSVTTSNFNFNNIQGKIIMNSNGAVSGANSNGVAQTFAQHRIDYPTFNINSISADPKFNDAQNLNFTLQSDSPHIKGANDYVSNIGGTEYAAYLKASDAEMTTGATVTNLTYQGNNSYTITSPNTTGSIISDAKFIQWPRTKPLTKIEWVGSLEFNKSITAGTQGNQNVPDYETSTTGAAASPDRLSLKMRFSTQQTKPTASGEWDNGGYWTAGDYRLFEVNQKPKIDSNGIGNGSSSYVEFAGLGDIVPSWIQVDVILINNYNP